MLINWYLLNFNREITRKNGPNYGKWFYNCKNDQCDFFEWSTNFESTYQYGSKMQRKRGYKS